jgi:aromatic ring-opening dioxygenase catalytic subunit (LigB family)
MQSLPHRVFAMDICQELLLERIQLKHSLKLLMWKQEQCNEWTQFAPFDEDIEERVTLQL